MKISHVGGSILLLAKRRCLGYTLNFLNLHSVYYQFELYRIVKPSKGSINQTSSECNRSKRKRFLEELQADPAEIAFDGSCGILPRVVGTARASQPIAAESRQIDKNIVLHSRSISTFFKIYLSPAQL